MLWQLFESYRFINKIVRFKGSQLEHLCSMEMSRHTHLLQSSFLTANTTTFRFSLQIQVNGPYTKYHHQIQYNVLL